MVKVTLSMMEQLYLILQPLYYTFKILGYTEKVASWKSKGSTTNDNSLSPSVKWSKNSNFCLLFKGSCLKHKAHILFLQKKFFLLFMN